MGTWKRCLPLLIRDTQIKTTVRYHLSQIRMAITEKSTNNTCWRGYGEKQTFLHCWWEGKLVQPLWKTVQKCLKKLKIELPYDPAIPFLGIYSDKSIISKNTFTPVFIAALFTIAKTQKQTKCSPTDEWIKKMCTHTHTRILLSHEKEWNNASSSNMGGPRDYHTKCSQKEKYHTLSVLCGIENTNEHIYETATDIRTNLWLPRGRKVGEGKIGSLGLAGANYYI